MIHLKPLKKIKIEQIIIEISIRLGVGILEMNKDDLSF